MIIIYVTGFPWNVLINILSECDITSHSEFIDLVFNIIPIAPVGATFSHDKVLRRAYHLFIHNYIRSLLNNSLKPIL